MTKILILICLIIGLSFYGCKVASDKIYDECMSSGEQSQAQCEFEAFYR